MLYSSCLAAVLRGNFLYPCRRKISALTSCITFGQLLHPFRSQSPYLWNGDTDTYIRSWGFGKILVKSPVYRRHSVNGRLLGPVVVMMVVFTVIFCHVRGALTQSPPPPIHHGWRIRLPRHDLLGEERWLISQRRRAQSLSLQGLLLGSFA